MGRRLLGRAFIAVLVVAPLVGCETVGGLMNNRYIGVRDYRADPSAKFEHLDLSVLMQSPNAGLEVQFDAIFRQHNEVVWAPHYTIFVPETYASFSVWPIGAKLWEVGGRVSYCPTLFIRKYDNVSFDDYLALNRYELVTVRGTVVSSFENRPWIRVFEIWRAGGPVYDNDTLALLLAGLNDADEKRHGGAIKHLNEALEGTLPPVAQAAAHNKLGWLYEFRGATTRKSEDWSRAEDHYQSALSVDPDDVTARDGIKRAERALARGGVGSPPPESASMGGASDSAVSDWKSKYDAEVAARRKADSDLKTANDARLAAEADATAAKSEAATAAKQVEDMNAASAKLQTEIEELRKTMAEGGDASKVLAEKITALEAEKAKLDEQVKAVTTERDELKAAQGGDEALKKQIAGKEAEMAKLTEERDALQKKLAEMPAGGAEAETLKKQIGDLNDTLETQKQVITSLREDKEKLEKEVEELKKKLAEKENN